MLLLFRNHIYGGVVVTFSAAVETMLADGSTPHVLAEGSGQHALTDGSPQHTLKDAG